MGPKTAQEWVNPAHLFFARDWKMVRAIMATMDKGADLEESITAGEDCCFVTHLYFVRCPDPRFPLIAVHMSHALPCRIVATCCVPHWQMIHWLAVNITGDTHTHAQQGSGPYGFTAQQSICLCPTEKWKQKRRGGGRGGWEIVKGPLSKSWFCRQKNFCLSDDC